MTEKQFMIDDELLDIYLEYICLVLSAYPRYGHYEMITKKDIKEFKEIEWMIIQIPGGSNT